MTVLIHNASQPVYLPALEISKLIAPSAPHAREKATEGLQLMADDVRPGSCVPLGLWIHQILHACLLGKLLMQMPKDASTPLVSPRIATVCNLVMAVAPNASALHPTPAMWQIMVYHRWWRK